MAKLARMWINQPSIHQQLHSLHGTNVLALWEHGDTYTIYFLSGPTVSMQVFGAQLSKGWRNE